MDNRSPSQSPIEPVSDETLLEMVHDIRACLRRTLTSAQMLERGGAGKLEERERGLLGAVVAASREMDLLLGRISEFANASHPVKSRPIPLLAAISAAVAGSPRLKIAVAIEPDAEAVAASLLVSPAVVRILGELLSNAEKFQPDADTAHITVSLNEAADVCVVVADRGIGIDSGSVEAVFEPLKRLRARDEFPGTGLGLSISRRLCQTIGATLTLAPAVPKGTLATLVLPGGRSGSA